MSNSLDNFLTRIGDVTIERVEPPGDGQSEADKKKMSGNEAQQGNPSESGSKEVSSEGCGGTENSPDTEQEKKVVEPMNSESAEGEARFEGSGDDMDLDETIDTQIGVRMEPQNEPTHSPSRDGIVDPANLLDSLPLEGINAK